MADRASPSVGVWSLAISEAKVPCLTGVPGLTGDLRLTGVPVPERGSGLAAAVALAVCTCAATSFAEDVPQDQIDAMRAALSKYEDPYVAVRDLYLSTVGCVHYDGMKMEGHMHYPKGAMGIHFVNLPGLAWLFSEENVPRAWVEAAVSDNGADLAVNVMNGVALAEGGKYRLNWRA